MKGVLIILLIGVGWLSGGCPGTKSPPVAAKSGEADIKRILDLGASAFNRGEMRESAHYFSQAITRNPQLALPYYGRGLARLQLREFREASGDFSQAVFMNPKFSLAYVGLALSYRNLGKYREAEQAYLAALRYDQENPLIPYNLGILYDLYLKRPEDALKNYRDYVRLLQRGHSSKKSEIDKVTLWIQLLEKSGPR